jgi:hypothetical protein
VHVTTLAPSKYDPAGTMHEEMADVPVVAVAEPAGQAVVEAPAPVIGPPRQ